MPRMWTDQWVRALPHPKPGAAEAVFKDPALSGHRLTVTRTKKKFEVQARQPRTRKSFVVIVGDATAGTTVEEARAKAAGILGKIRAGDDPRSKAKDSLATLGAAWTEYEARTDLRPSVLTTYRSVYDTHLAAWANVPLRTLLDNPRMAKEMHERITKESGPSAADHAARLLRSIYRNAAKLDTALPRDRHPCSAVEWHGDRKREDAAIPAKQMPAWKKQLDDLRAMSPARAAFQLLVLRLGCRPGELAKAEWEHVDLKNKLLWIPVSKTEAYEVPIPRQAIAEFKALAETRESHFIFAARGKAGHLARLQEARLSHSSNEMRHSHHTVGTVLGINEMVLDVLEGRTLLKAGAAGRGYIDRGELGPQVRAAQDAINARIDVLFKSGREKARAA